MVKSNGLVNFHLLAATMKINFTFFSMTAEIEKNSGWIKTKKLTLQIDKAVYYLFSWKESVSDTIRKWSQKWSKKIYIFAFLLTSPLESFAPSKFIAKVLKKKNFKMSVRLINSNCRVIFQWLLNSHFMLGIFFKYSVAKH